MDSEGDTNDIIRDKNGNITSYKITRKSGAIINHELSGYDDKKSYTSLNNGWPFDIHRNSTVDYLTTVALNSVGANGNATLEKITSSVGMAELEYKYQYTEDGYPIVVEVMDKATNKVISKATFNLSDCK